MRAVFSAQGVKGVVIACQDCGQNHFYEWELLRDNLEHMLDSGEPRMHEPAFDIAEDEYIQWDYGKGYVDALTDTGLEPGRTVEVTQCPWCETPFDRDFRFCPPVRPLARRDAAVPGASRTGDRGARGAGDAGARRVRALLSAGTGILRRAIYYRWVSTSTSPPPSLMLGPRTARRWWSCSGSAVSATAGRSCAADALGRDGGADVRVARR